MTFALTAHAVSAAPLLRAIDQRAFTTVGELAEQADRHANHMSRDLARLEEGGLIRRGEGGITDIALTEAGRHALAQVASAEAFAPHAAFAENPFNPRKTFDEAELRALAETIADVGLIHPLTAGPARARSAEDASLVRTLYAGHRRWRAIGLLIEDGRWPANRPIPFTERASDDPAVALHIALVENGQARPLTEYEEALGFDDWQAKSGLAAAELARRAGKDVRVVQERIKVARQASKAAVARYLDPDDHEFGWKQLRDSVKAAEQVGQPQAPALFDAPPPELSPGLALALLELAVKADREAASEFAEPGYTRLWSEPVVGPLPALKNRGGLVTIRNLGGEWFAKVNRYSSPAGRWLELNLADNDPDEVIRQARIALVGESLTDKLEAEGRWATAELNPPNTQAESPEERDAAAQASPPDAATTPAPLAGSMAGDGGEDPGATSEPAPGPDRRGERVGWPEEPKLDDDQRLILLEVAHKIAAKGKEQAGGVRAAGVGDYWDDARAKALVQHRLITTFTGRAGKGEWLVALQQRGKDVIAQVTGGVLAELEWEIRELRTRLSDRETADALSGHDRYATAWLNPEAGFDPLVVGGRRYGNLAYAEEARRKLSGARSPAASPSRPAPPAAQPKAADPFGDQLRQVIQEGEAEDQAGAAEALRQVHADVVDFANALARGTGDAWASFLQAGGPDRFKLLLAQVVESVLPGFSEETSDEHRIAGNVLDGNDTVFLTVDADGERDPEEVKAGALLAAIALNVCCGLIDARLREAPADAA